MPTLVIYVLADAFDHQFDRIFCGCPDVKGQETFYFFIKPGECESLAHLGTVVPTLTAALEVLHEVSSLGSNQLILLLDHTSLAGTITKQKMLKLKEEYPSLPIIGKLCMFLFPSPVSLPIPISRTLTPTRST